MREEHAPAVIESRNGVHLDLAQAEVEDVEVFLQALAVHGLGSGNHVALDEPAQEHLGHGAVMGPSDGGEDLVDEEIVAPLGKGSPGFKLHLALGQDGKVLVPLAEGVDLHLVHLGHDLAVAREVDEPVGIEVADADGPHALFLQYGLESAPGA